MTRILFAIILTTMSFFFMLNAQNPQTNVYVATNGSDANSGTLTEPFATIQHAVKVMNPGDICYIRGGTYREEVDLSGVAGESGAPITLTHYQDEEVILSGTVPITSNWTHHIGNIYKTTLSEDIWQLFVDGKHMTLARFPNALTFSDLMWDRNMARRMKDPGQSTMGMWLMIQQAERLLRWLTPGCLLTTVSVYLTSAIFHRARVSFPSTLPEAIISIIVLLRYNIEQPMAISSRAASMPRNWSCSTWLKSGPMTNRQILCIFGRTILINELKK